MRHLAIFAVFALFVVGCEGDKGPVGPPGPQGPGDIVVVQRTVKNSDYSFTSGSWWVDIYDARIDMSSIVLPYWGSASAGWSSAIAFIIADGEVAILDDGKNLLGWTLRVFVISDPSLVPLIRGGEWDVKEWVE